MEIEKYIIYKKAIEARNANYSDFPKGLYPEIKSYLLCSGIDKLYSHQTETFNSVRDGKNVIITTSTASGKTLSFLLPILQEMLENPKTRAIFVYPTKALASDQYKALKMILHYVGNDSIMAGVYDGDTPVSARSEIRRKANIILTNPEMLNGAFLPNHARYGFDNIFRNLKYIVFDELHVYRGAFGSHVANIMKRMNRICKYYNTSPQIICSSATIANPIELAENIFSKKFVLIDKDGSPATEKTFNVVLPPLIKDTVFQIPNKELIEPLMLKLTIAKRGFIVFCESRNEVEVITREAREQLKSEQIFNEDKSNLISGYRGGYLPNERKEIENKMSKGEIVGLVSTNALELGMDIGSLDTVILDGFPQTRASFWQRAGRAGRKGQNADVYVVLEQRPIDQYIASSPEWLFNAGSENAVVDKNNFYIQLAHCRSAAAELPLSLDDVSIFPDLSEILSDMLAHNEIENIDGKFVWIGKSFPAGDYSLRNIDSKRYKVIDIEREKILTEVDKYQAYTQLYKGAIYIHDTTTYEVIAVNIERTEITVKESYANYYTHPMPCTELDVLEILETKTFEKTFFCFSDIKVKTFVEGFKKIQFRNSQNLGYEKVQVRLAIELYTKGVLLQIPSEAVKKLEAESKNADRYSDDIYSETVFALKTASQMITMTSISDIDSAIKKDEKGNVYICIYDNYQGGLGFSGKIFTLMPEVIKNTITMLNGCRCKDGCPACIGSNNPDKEIVLWLLRSMFEEINCPEFIPSTKIEQNFIEKEFNLDTLPKTWDQLKRKCLTSGEYLSSFISSIDKIGVRKSKLILYVKDQFTKRWIDNSPNLDQLKNSLTYYIDVPKDFSISIEIQSHDDTDERKINKNYGRFLRKED